ncbi:MAG: sulfotransferase domain-containing protein [Aestuariivirgaceae bacterium]|nr:sulfotransferase domain-containing protein [Aestuariivirgaceae bacterium]
MGAQKAGTTWLSKYLTAAPEVTAGSLKEFHIWDALYSPACRGALISNPTLGKIVFGGLFLHPRRLRRQKLRWAMQNDEENYFSYFAKLLETPGKRIAYDITPSYSCLPSQAISRISQGFQRRDITTKAIFLMRDPVERCWSAARMLKDLKAGTTDVTGEEVLIHAMSEAAEIRTRYNLTQNALREALAEENIYVGLYEEMHRQEKIEAISEFCGVTTDLSMMNERVNARQKVSELNTGFKAKIALHYRDVYDTTARAYPQALDLWSGYRYL